LKIIFWDGKRGEARQLQGYQHPSLLVSSCPPIPTQFKKLVNHIHEH
jgi:hypothetical protein